MSRYHSHLNSAQSVLKQYKGAEPLAAFLKKFFAAEKKYGSRDRKQISQLCYSYFRLGKNNTGGDVSGRMLDALFLCSESPSDILSQLHPIYNDHVADPLTDKIKLTASSYSLPAIFPWKELLSKGIHYELFCASFLVQPNLFLRIRPGYESVVKEKLKGQGVITEDVVQLPNSIKIDELLDIDKEVVVQDLSSQRIRELLALVPVGVKGIDLWDCCAASGGKSILAKDVLKQVNITVTDIRESILVNLGNRFRRAGIHNYRSFVRDLADHNGKRLADHYDLIICDAPCTGSGTWSRTPEQLYFFDPSSIPQFSTLQKKIVQTVIPQLKTGAYFLYITCSVFAGENEEIVEFIQEKFPLKLVKMTVLSGYEQRADSMFAALFSV